ncbi:MAG: hypothetical protein ACI4JM_09255 [Oscillospiraceae bacterium]
MTKSDGSIRIDTTINTSNFTEKIEKMKAAMQNFAGISNQAFTNQSKAIISYQAKIQQTEAEISRLTQQMNILRSQPVTNSTIENLKVSIAQTEKEIQKVTDLIKNLKNQTGDVKLMTKFSSQIDEAKMKLYQLDEKRAAMLNAEVSAITPAGLNQDDYIGTAEKNLQKTSSEWRNINKEIQKTESEIVKYKQKLDEASKIKGINTADYSAAQKKLDSLNSKLDTYRSKLQNAEKSEKNKISDKFAALSERVDKANAKLKEYNQQMSQAGEKTEKTKNKTSALNTGINTLMSSMKKLALVFGVTFSVRQLYNWSKAWKDAYKVQLQSETQVATTMLNSTNATLENVQAIKELASAQQRLGVVGDEVQLAGLQQLAVYSDEADTLKKLLPAMNNLAAQRYGYVVTTENAKSVADLFGKALQGNTAMLKRNGFALSESQENIFKYGTESERAALLAEMVSKNIGNMNEALASTDIGKQQQLANTVGDLKELYGNIVSKIYTLMIPALNKLVTLLTNIGNLALDGLRSVYKLLGKDFDTTNLSIGSMAGDIDTATDSAENLADAVSDVEKASKGALASFDELEVIGKSDNPFNDETADNLYDTANSSVNANSAMSDLKETTDELDLSSSKLYQSLKKLWEVLKPFAENIGEGLAWFHKNVLVPLGTWTVNKAVPAFLDLLSSAIGFLNAVIEVFKPLGLWLWEEFLKPLASFAGDLAISAIKGIANAVQGLTNFITENKDEIETWIPVFSGIAAGLATAFAFKWITGLAPKFAKITALILKFSGKVKYLYNAFMALAGVNGIIGGIGASISALWLTFRNFMTGLSPLAKIGVTITALAATITTAYSAFKKLSDGSISLGKAIANISVVAVPAGVALYAMLGPIGAVAVALGALIGAFAGAASAQKEMAQEMVTNAVFDGIGTPITEYSNTIKGLADTISNEQSRILELGNSIEMNNQTIDDNLTNLSMLMGSVKATGDLTEESANKIIESFNAVADGISENLSLGTQGIIEGLGTSFNDLAGASGSMVSEMLSQLYLLQSEGDAYLATLKSDFAEAEMAMLNLDPNSAEYEEAAKKVEDLRKEITEYSMITNDAVTSADMMQQSLDNLSDEKIDLMNVSTASQCLTDMAANYKQAMDDLKNANSLAVKSIENEKEALKYRQGFLSADDIQFFNDLSKLVDENYTSQEQELTTTFKNVNSKIEKQLTKSIDDAMIDAQAEASQGITGYFNYLGAYIKTIGTDKTADQYLHDTLYDSVAGETIKALQDAETVINTEANMLGLNVVDGVISGINDNADNAKSAIDDVSNAMQTEFKEKNDIHSPSKVYDEYGMYIVQGLSQGISNNAVIAITSVAQLMSNMLDVSQSGLGNLVNAFNSAFDSVLNSMQNFNYNMITGIKDTLNTIISDLNTMFGGINAVQFELPMGTGHFGVDIPAIPHLATGGLIPPRSEFMAVLGDNRRENEIVSPVSAMKQAVMEAISESGISSDRPINLYLDGEILFSSMRDKNRQYVKQTGKSAF